MAFFRKVIDNILNKVLVETLANSRWFQRFAVHMHKLSKEMAEKGKDQSQVMDKHVSSFAVKAREAYAQLRKDFEQELRKLQEADPGKHVKK